MNKECCSRDDFPSKTENSDDNKGESGCSMPCDPSSPCGECADFWKTMKKKKDGVYYVAKNKSVVKSLNSITLHPFKEAMNILHDCPWLRKTNNE